MKKKVLLSSLIILTLTVTFFNLGYIIKNSFYDNIEVLPEGEFLYSSMSPDGENTVSVYRVENDKMVAIRGALVKVTENGNISETNIFWQVGADSAIVGWHSNRTVSINNQIIDVTSENYYDSRNDYSKYIQ
ncbi:MAG: hypothetical protein IJP26_02235 [Clostridia bacterium]|nr:hypothetical protein [Clostridia bacterium]